MAVIATDNFDRGTGIGANWTNILGAVYTITANKADPSNHGADSNSIWNANPFPDDQYVQVVVSALTGFTVDAGTGVLLRGSGSGGTAAFYRIVVNEDTLALQRYASGTYQETVTTRATAFVDGDVLRAEMQGTTMRVYHNGIQLGADITEPNIASGSPGLGYSSTITNPEVDNWEAGDFVSAANRYLTRHSRMTSW